MPAAGGKGGGGSGGDDIRAGGAYVELYGRDKLTPALDKVEDKIKKFAKTAKSVASVEGTFGKLLNLAGTGGALGVGVGAALEALKGMRSVIVGNLDGADAFRKQLEASALAAGRISTSIADAAAAARETAGALGTRAEKAGALGGGLDKIRADIDQLMQQRADAEAAKADAYETNVFRTLLGSRDDRRKLADDWLADVNSKIDVSMKTLRDLTAETKKLLDPTADIAKIREAIDAVGGGGKLEGIVGQVMELKRQMGGHLDDGLFATLLGEAGAADTAVKVGEATRSLDGYLDTVRQAGLEAGKTAHEVALMRAEMSGVDLDKIADARRELMGAGGANLLVGSLLPMLGQIEAARKASVEGMAATVRGGFSVGGSGVAAQIFGGGVAEGLLAKIAAGEGGLPQSIGHEVAKNMHMR